MRLQTKLLFGILIINSSFLSLKAALAEDKSIARAPKASSPIPDEILRRVDAIRCPESSFVMEVDIEARQKDELVKQHLGM